MADDHLLAFEAHLALVDPELLAQFEATYERPKRDHANVGERGYVDNGACLRCGAMIGTMAAWTIHVAWHRALSLAIYAQGSTLRFLAEELTG